MSEQDDATRALDPAIGRKIEELGPWYHTIDLGSGIETPGRGRAAPKFFQVEPFLPDDLTGLDVLDLGCNAGGVAIEFCRRGANVVGLEPVEHYYRQACWLRDYLQLSTFNVHRLPVYELTSVGSRFDIVLFLGLIYHLRYPQLALDAIASVCDGRMFLSTPYLATRQRVLENRLPTEYEQGTEGPVTQAQEGRYNWWFPSESALRRMLSAAGFSKPTIISKKTESFVSSNVEVDNRSAFPTGQLHLWAECTPTTSLPTIAPPK